MSHLGIIFNKIEANKYYACEVCVKNVDCNSDLNKHIEKEHKQIVIECYICDLLFQSKRYSKRHIKLINNWEYLNIFLDFISFRKKKMSLNKNVYK